MASTENWQTVKNSKKAKSSPIGTKKKQKDFVDSMPRLSHARPVKESETLFGALIEKDSPRAKPVTLKAAATSNGGSQSSSRIPQPKSKKNPDKFKKSKHVPLDEAIKTIKLKELHDVLEEDKIKFPSNPTVWLMDLASYLNLKLDKVLEEDPVFHNKPCDFPLSRLSAEVEDQFARCLKTCALNTASQFLYTSVQAMLADQSQGISTYGYRIAIQIIARHRPEVTLRMLPKLIQLIRSNQNEHSKCLAIMWVAGQVGWRHLDTGVQVWREVMLPLLNIRAIASFVVEYVERLFKMASTKAIVQDGLEVNNFFVLYDLIMDGHPPNLSDQLQRRLLQLLPMVKESAFKIHPVQNIKAFFASFLDRLRQENSVKAREELLNCLVLCLSMEKDGVCCTSWQHLYPKHLYQSSILLSHLSTNPDACNRIGRTKLVELLDQFQTYNEKLSKKGSNKPDYTHCVKACQELKAALQSTKKEASDSSISSSLFSFKGAFFLLFLVAAIVIGRDVNKLGWEKSQTREFLRDYHVLCALEETWRTVKIGLDWIWSVLDAYVPVYYAKAKLVLGPYVEKFIALSMQLLDYLLEVTLPARQWLTVQLGLLVNWVDAQLPWIWSYTLYYLGLVFGFLLRWTVIAWGYISNYLLIAGAWLQQHVFYGSWSPDNIAAVAARSLRVLQDQIYSFGNSMSSMVQNLPPFKAG